MNENSNNENLEEVVDNKDVKDDKTEESSESGQDNNSNSEANDVTERDLKEDVKLLKDQLLRAVAEGENIRKRFEKQIEDTAKFAIASFAKDLINVIENLERATETITQEVLTENPLVKTISEGIEMTKRELFSVFEKNNIVRINPLKGDKFDHNFHQAVSNIGDSGLESNSIVAVMQAGYVINDRLLRPAIVTVAQ